MNRHLLTIGLTSLFLAACTSNPSKPVSLSGTHIHGLAVDRGDSSRVYIATHHGLFLLQNDKDLSLVGNVRADYMGFSPHPTTANIIFSSGHPAGGGNLGVQKTTDGGVSWTKLSNGDPSRPVDFHAMTVSEANPNLIIGWFSGHLYRSEDGGTTWNALSASVPPIITLGSDLKDERVLYVGTEDGLLKSTDTGETWANASSSFTDTVIDIEADPATGGLLLATPHGIVRTSLGAGGSMKFDRISTLPDEAIAHQIAVDRRNPQVMYATSEHTVYKSTDGGKSWKKVL